MKDTGKIVEKQNKRIKKSQSASYGLLVYYLYWER